MRQTTWKCLFTISSVLLLCTSILMNSAHAEIFCKPQPIFSRSIVKAASNNVLASWPVFRHDPQHTGLSPYAGSETATQKWFFTTGDQIQASSPAIGADGTIYIGSMDQNLYAVNSDGSQKWAFTAGGQIYSSPAIGSDGTAYFGAFDGVIYAVNSEGTGTWTFQTGGQIESSPNIGPDGTIYVASDDKQLYAINPDGSQKWVFFLGDGGGSSPAVGKDGTIYVGDWDGTVYALDVNGSAKWAYQTGDSIDASPALGSDGTVYVGLDGISTEYQTGTLIAVKDGIFQWAFPTGATIFSSPAVGTDGTIYIGSFDTYLYAVTPAGAEKWAFQTGDHVNSSPAIDANGTVYVGSNDNYLYAVNPDGSGKWAFQTGGIVLSSPAIGADGTIYVGSYDQNLYAIATPPPGITIGGPSVTTTIAGPVSYAVTYSNVSTITLSPAEVTLNPTGTAAGTVTVSGTDNVTRTVTISNITGAGTLGISIASGTATGPGGSAPAAGPSATFTVTPPIIVNILSPSSPGSYLTSSTTLNMSGTVTGGATITSVTWADSAGGNGTATGTTSWSISQMPLQPGTNRITVTATDSLGNTGQAQIAVIESAAQTFNGMEMVSLPIIPTNTDPKQVCGFSNDDWETYRPNLGSYAVYPDPFTFFGDPTTPTPGRGFWAEFAAPVAFPSGPIPTQDQPITIHLLKGWNQIGDPFIKPVTWNTSAIQVYDPVALTTRSMSAAGDTVGNFAWGWQQKAGDPMHGNYFLVFDPAIYPGFATTLQPWQGYWVLAYKDCDLILPAP